MYNMWNGSRGDSANDSPDALPLSSTIKHSGSFAALLGPCAASRSSKPVEFTVEVVEGIAFLRSRDGRFP